MYMKKEKVSIYSPPLVKVVDIKPGSIICNSPGGYGVEFGRSGGAGSDIDEDDIIDGGSF